MKKLIFLPALACLFIISSCKKDEKKPSPKADFTYTGGGCTAPCAILFDNKSTNATNYNWDFGDGTTSKEENPTKTYDIGGTYTVTLTANGEDGSDQTSKKILVQKSAQSQLPNADFTFSGGGCMAPCNVNFKNNSTNATSFSWDFGDGTTSTEEDPSKTYNTGGSFSVILTATNAAGQDQITKIVNIASPPTKVKITKITINDMPFVDGNGSSWDLSNGPDVFVNITDQSDNVLLDGESSRIDDVVSSDLPISWSLTTPFEITDFNVLRYIELWDYDSFLNPNDYIGSVGFTMKDYTSGNNPYPTNVTNSIGGITVKLDIEWQ